MKKTFLLYSIILVSTLLSCDKQNEWLEIKTTKNDVSPETVADYQAILDNFQYGVGRVNHNIGLMATDNILIADNDLGRVSELEKNVYTFQVPVWKNGSSVQWNYAFQVIAYANIVIDGLQTISPQSNQWQNVMGQALFYRALANYNLAGIFCKVYDKATAQNDLGLPIRTTSDVNIVIGSRSNLEETYQHIISDLIESLTLLPEQQPYIQRPSLYAAKGLLAKVYLAMEDYVNAYKNADEVLLDYNILLDFNNEIINYEIDSRFPVNGNGNPEVLFYTIILNMSPPVLPRTTSVGYIPDELYNLYAQNDLRKKAFYTFRNDLPRYIGSYTGNNNDSFAGIATNEILLIRAESAARLGDAETANKDLNKLLENRYVSNTFEPYNVSDPEEILAIILTEKRKELPFTANLRWEDLRRLNKDPRFQKTIKRTVNGTVIELPPNSPRWVFPIPETEIQLSGIEQN